MRFFPRFVTSAASAAAALTVAACSIPSPLVAQTVPVVLEVDLANKVQYHEDVAFDPTRFATNSGPTTVTRPLNFGKFVSVADIVAVNGQPVKGLALYNTRVVTLRASPVNPGEGIADLDRNGVIDQMFEFLNTDGVPIGTILASGLSAGAAPPGSPLQVVQGNLAIYGGTGAFFGARGSVGQGPTTTADRVASMIEDPGNRRKNGGGSVRIIITFIPQTQPAVVMTASGPAIVHSADFTPVTSAKPAAAGEILSMVVTGLGPTHPGVNPGQAFPATGLATVSSPIDVTVNGVHAEVVGAAGYPGTLGAYQVNFRVPPGAGSGAAAVQLTAAWIPSGAVTIPLQ